MTVDWKEFIRPLTAHVEFWPARVLLALFTRLGPSEGAAFVGKHSTTHYLNSKIGCHPVLSNPNLASYFLIVGEKRRVLTFPYGICPISEYNELHWNSNSNHQILNPSGYPLPHRSSGGIKAKMLQNVPI